MKTSVRPKNGEKWESRIFFFLQCLLLSCAICDDMTLCHSLKVFSTWRLLKCHQCGSGPLKLLKQENLHGPIFILIICTRQYFSIQNIIITLFENIVRSIFKQGATLFPPFFFLKKILFCSFPKFTASNQEYSSWIQCYLLSRLLSLKPNLRSA